MPPMASPRASENASFELQGSAQAGRLNLSTPLGSVLAQARWAPGSVVLATPQGERSFADLDALTREVLGESVPVAALFDWLRGRPWAGAASVASASVAEPGFAQLGWSVSLARFDDGLVVARRDRRARRHGARKARSLTAMNAIHDVVAPAKLNLFLHVVGRRADGYHLLQSLFVLIDWCDTLHFERRSDGSHRPPRPRHGAPCRRPVPARRAPAASSERHPTGRSTSRSTSRCPGAPVWAAAAPTRPPRCSR